MLDTRKGALRLLTQANGDSAAFHAGQREAIEAVLQPGARMLVVQRTGWGKSVVYFIAARLLRDMGRGPTLLISPLLALMRNQVEMAARYGVRAATINSSNRDEWSGVISRVKNGDIDCLLISPERLGDDDFRENVVRPLEKGCNRFCDAESRQPALTAYCEECFGSRGGRSKAATSNRAPRATGKPAHSKRGIGGTPKLRSLDLRLLENL